MLRLLWGPGPPEGRAHEGALGEAGLLSFVLLSGGLGRPAVASGRVPEGCGEKPAWMPSGSCLAGRSPGAGRSC